MSLDPLKELAGREMKRNVWLPVRIKDQDVVVTRLRVEPISCVRDDLVRVRIAEVEVTVAGGQDLGVDLDSGDVDLIAECEPVLPRRRAGGQAEKRNRPRCRGRILRRPERVGEQQVVPVAVGEIGLAVIHGVDRLPLVEDQLCS